MLPRWLQWFRPKRRWFQYRLRTLFVLMTLVCVWLSYNAWRYHREQEVVAGITAHDPEAEIIWAGPSWLNWLDKDSVPAIFRRVRAVKFNLKADTSAQISQELLGVRVQNLSALKRLTLITEHLLLSQVSLDALLPGVELVWEYHITIKDASSAPQLPPNYDLIDDHQDAFPNGP